MKKSVQDSSLLIWYKCDGNLLNSSDHTGYNATVTGSGLSDQLSRFNQPAHALRYAGAVGRSITIPIELTNGNIFSIGAWIYRDPDQTINLQNNFLFGSKITDVGIKFYIDSTYHVCATNGNCQITSAATLEEGWSHIGYSVGGSYLNYFQNLYINGALDTHATHTYISPWYAYPLNLCQASDDTDGSSAFQFTFDDFRYYNVLLTDDEMASVYHDTFKTYFQTGSLYKFRCVVEHASALYYPDIVHINTNATFTWSCPTATIEIITNNNIGDSNYMGALREDDVVRLQVCYRTSDTQTEVWQDIFEGRIYGMAAGNNTTLYCRGHDEELLYKLITADASYTSSTSGEIISALISTYCSRIGSSGGIKTGVRTPVYNVVANTKYVSDIISAMESSEIYGYKFSVKPLYDSGDLLQNVGAVWEPVGQATHYITEGSRPFISATFTSTSQNKFNNIKVFGSGTNYATATSGAADRIKVVVDKTLSSNIVCQEIANSVLATTKDSQVSGGIVVIGNPNIHVGDYVVCEIPSIILNGASIANTYTVTRVAHTITTAGYITTLDVGRITLEISEIIAAQSVAIRLTNANWI